MARRVLAFLAAFPLCLVTLAGPAAAAQWHFETLDGAGGPNGRTTNTVGLYNAVTLYGGQAHVWYWDETAGDLRHGWWNGAAWSFETLDGAGGPNGRIDANVGETSAVTLYGGQPHVWYRDHSNGDLRHGWWSGTAWSFETLDGAGGPNGRTTSAVGVSSAVLQFGGQPHVWYWEEDGYLRHGWWNGAVWNFETLDGAGGPNGRTNANVGVDNAVTLYGGQPHVWYRDYSNGDLRHGWWNGTAWNFETLDGAGGPNGRIDAYVGESNAVTLYGGQLHVWYGDGTNDVLRHGWWSGTVWNFETLDGAGGPNGRTTSAVGVSSAVTLYGAQPHVWYREEDNGDLRHGWWNGAVWNFETLDGAGGPNGRIDANVGWDNAVTLYAGQPHVWYRDYSNGDLRHGWWG